MDINVQSLKLSRVRLSLNMPRFQEFFRFLFFFFFFYVVDVCFPAIRFRMQNGAADRIRSRELAVETRRLID